MHAFWVAAFAVVALAACGGTTAGTSHETPPDASPGDGSAGDGSACPTTSQSDLPGVHIEVDPSRCVFTLAEAHAGIAIGYDVIVDASVPGVVPRSQDAGNCGAPDGSGLIPFESVAGSGQHYCVCDTGLCPPPTGAVVTLPAGRYHHTFMWDGTNWNGPSDTGNPEGPPFPAGTYTLTVSAIGSQMADGSASSFKVVGTLAITLTP